MHREGNIYKIIVLASSILIFGILTLTWASTGVLVGMANVGSATGYAGYLVFDMNIDILIPGCLLGVSIFPIIFYFCRNSFSSKNASYILLWLLASTSILPICFGSFWLFVSSFPIPIFLTLIALYFFPRIMMTIFGGIIF